MTDKKTMTISGAVERMITAVNIVTGDDGHRSQEAVKTFLELLKMEDKDYNKQQIIKKKFIKLSAQFNIHSFLIDSYFTFGLSTFLCTYKRS